MFRRRMKRNERRVGAGLSCRSLVPIMIGSSQGIVKIIHGFVVQVDSFHS